MSEATTIVTVSRGDVQRLGDIAKRVTDGKFSVLSIVNPGDGWRIHDGGPRHREFRGRYSIRGAASYYLAVIYGYQYDGDEEQRLAADIALAEISVSDQLGPIYDELFNAEQHPHVGQCWDRGFSDAAAAIKGNT